MFCESSPWLLFTGYRNSSPPYLSVLLLTPYDVPFSLHYGQNRVSKVWALVWSA